MESKGLGGLAREEEGALRTAVGSSVSIGGGVKD